MLSYELHYALIFRKKKSRYKNIEEFINHLALELFFLILAHPVYKM